MLKPFYTPALLRGWIQWFPLKPNGTGNWIENLRETYDARKKIHYLYRRLETLLSMARLHCGNRYPKDEAPRLGIELNR